MGNDSDLPKEDFCHFEQAVICKYGLLMSSSDLAEVFGFASLDALRQARRRKKINLKMFKIDGRAGTFALSVDVAHYLWQLRNEREVQTN